ncbi:zona pellucida protein AX 4 [Scomber japonicus]|uniref:zona pellucida protein AX 4 n=1 Tax=Scomber japonicus TaxID=13676 RepID=UPI002306D0C0|nr:zona pellucida protein AX 4 [Scomber japonicus]
MAFGSYISVTLLLSVWATATCNRIPEGAISMECRNRYLMIAVDLSYTEDEVHFEAVDETGVYPITEQFAAECGYTVSVLPLQGLVELRASYFSCHTDNKDDDEFTFNFNLIATYGGLKDIYALNKTCSPSLPWSLREVTCEVNYMEVSVKSDVACPTGTKKDDWDAAVQTAYTSATSDWQVMFQKGDQELMPMNLSEAHEQHYAFDLTDGRLIFRTPYGQPDSFSTTVNGVPVEVVHATLFSKQSWVVLMVDLVAACSMYEGSYDNGYMMWETPEVLHPQVSGLLNTHVNIGVDGELVEEPVAEERGYIVEKHNSTVYISIPYNAEGGYRKSFVSGDLNEYFIFNLYLELISLDEDHIDTRLHYHRTLATPLLPRPVFTENKTVVEEHAFTVYLSDVPDDVELVAVQLNGHDFALPFSNTSTYSISKVVQPNTHSYTLTVPFDDPVVIQQFSKEDAAMQHQLNINYTLTVQPENDPYYHFTSVTALTDVSPPTFDTVCSESGISFRLDHQPSDYLWDISIGSDLLTQELAEQRGYIMSNDSQSLLLEVPLFTEGYEYKDFTLKGFFGTFEILVRDHETAEVQSSVAKTCPFSTTELIACSTDGRMTVVADLSLAIPSGGIPARANLIDKYCGPKEVDSTRALFSFPVNTCGSRVMLSKEHVTYENEIFFTKKFHAGINKSDPSIDTDRVTMKCTYPLAGLHRLFSVYRFESDTAGVGRILHSAHLNNGPQSPTMEPTTGLQTPVSTTRRTRRPISIRPQFSQISSYLKNISKKGTCKDHKNGEFIRAYWKTLDQLDLPSLTNPTSPVYDPIELL